MLTFRRLAAIFRTILAFNDRPEAKPAGNQPAHKAQRRSQGGVGGNGNGNVLTVTSGGKIVPGCSVLLSLGHQSATAQQEYTYRLRAQSTLRYIPTLMIAIAIN